jgi:hypothetical protein
MRAQGSEVKTGSRSFTASGFFILLVNIFKEKQP